MRVSLPEQVWVDLKPAGFGSRVLAFLVDCVILLFAELTLIITIVFISELFFSNSLDFALAHFSMGSIFNTGTILVVAMFCIAWGYHVFFEVSCHGISPGKKIFGLRVVDEEGLSFGLQASAIRNLLRIVDFMPFGGLVAFVSMSLTERQQRLGDIAAGTIVIYDPEQEYKNVGTNSQKLSEGILLLPVSHYNILESFLSRRTELATHAADFTANELSNLFLPLLKGVDVPPMTDNFELLEWVYKNSYPAKSSYQDAKRV